MSLPSNNPFAVANKGFRGLGFRGLGFRVWGLGYHYNRNPRNIYSRALGVEVTKTPLINCRALYTLTHGTGVWLF